MSVLVDVNSCCRSDVLVHLVRCFVFAFCCFFFLFLISFLSLCIFRSSNLNSEDAAAYLERFRKEVEVVDNKLAKDRKRQEQKLHQKLTALKQKRIEEKVLAFAQRIIQVQVVKLPGQGLYKTILLSE